MFFVELAHLLEPLVSQQLSSAWALRNILVQAVSHKVLGVLAHVVKRRLVQVYLPCTDQALGVLLVSTREGVLARQQHVGDHAQAPDVHFLVVLLALDEFWRHVKRTSEHEFQSLLGVKEAGESKISKLDFDGVPVL